MFKLEVSLIVILLLALSNANRSPGRTCACAQFVKEECESTMDPGGNDFCVWNEIDDTKGVHHICRTKKFWDCHADQDCHFHKGNIPGYPEYRRLGGLEDAISLGEISEDDLIAYNPNVDIDWPYGCKTDDNYHDNVLAKASVVGSSNNNNNNDMLLGGLIICGGLIGFAAFWKCNNGKKTQYPLSATENRGESYSTFV